MVKRLMSVVLPVTLLYVLASCAPGTTPTPSPAPLATSKPEAATPAAQATSKPAAATPAAHATAKPAAKPLEKAKISMPTAGAANLLFDFAAERGFFKEEGVDMEVVVIQAPLTMPALLNGEIDYTGLLGSSLQAALKGEPVRVLMVTTDKPNWKGYMAPGMTDPKQIEGKSWGISSGGSATHAAQDAVRYLKLDPSKVTFVRFPTDKEMMTGLKSGSVAAGSLTPPTSNQAALEGMKLAVDTADIMDAPTKGIGTTLKRIQGNPDQVKRVPRAILAAMDYMKGHKDEAVQLIAAKFSLEKDMAQQIVDEEVSRCPGKERSATADCKATWRY